MNASFGAGADVSIETFSLEIPESLGHLTAFGWQGDRRDTWLTALEALILSRLKDGVALLRWAVVRFEQDRLWCEGAYLKKRAKALI